MAWIELHDTLPDHPKVIEVADELKMDKDMVVGKIVRLWTWALQNRESGVFSARDVETIKEIMRFKGRADRLVTALVNAGLLDRNKDGSFTIHDWDERVGMLLAKRESKRAQDRERKRRQRERENDKDDTVTPDVTPDVTRDGHASHAATVPKPNIEEEQDTSTTDAREDVNTDVDNVDNVENTASDVVRRKYTEFFGKPSDGDMSLLADLESMYDTIDVYRAVDITGKRSPPPNEPMAYIRTVLADWKKSGQLDGEVQFHLVAEGG